MSEMIQTSHGLATKESVIENDLPYWRETANHAIKVFNDLAMKTGQQGFYRSTLSPDKPK